MTHTQTKPWFQQLRRLLELNNYCISASPKGNEKLKMGEALPQRTQDKVGYD